MGKKKMQWEVRPLDDGRWGIFLKQELCRTDEPVCYGAGKNKISIERSCERLNTEPGFRAPIHSQDSEVEFRAWIRRLESKPALRACMQGPDSEPEFRG